MGSTVYTSRNVGTAAEIKRRHIVAFANQKGLSVEAADAHLRESRTTRDKLLAALAREIALRFTWLRTKRTTDLIAFRAAELRTAKARAADHAFHLQPR